MKEGAHGRRPMPPRQHFGAPAKLIAQEADSRRFLAWAML
jgi:hypothetical protein